MSFHCQPYNSVQFLAVSCPLSFLIIGRQIVFYIPPAKYLIDYISSVLCQNFLSLLRNQYLYSYEVYSGHKLMVISYNFVRFNNIIRQFCLVPHGVECLQMNRAPPFFVCIFSENSLAINALFCCHMCIGNAMT